MILGEKWSQNTKYDVGDYIYPTTENNYIYICIQAGISQSYSKGYSNSVEPLWQINTDVLDGILVWRFVESLGIEDFWLPNTEYGLGNRVKPSTGYINWNGKDYCYELNRVVAEPVWPVKLNTKVVDGTVIWETQISSSTFVPKEIKTEPVFSEVVKMIDYLSQKDEVKLYLDEVLNKHADRKKLSPSTIYQIVNELGYDYIANIFNLTKDEVSALLGYTSLLHILKGERSGFELALDLMGLSYHIEEWWEKSPKGEADTFDLFVNVNLSTITADTISKLLIFVRNYVYPQMAKFNLNYLVNFIQANASMAGFVDTTFYGNIDYIVLTATMGGFIDTTYYGTWLSGLADVILTDENGSALATPDGRILVGAIEK